MEQQKIKLLRSNTLDLMFDNVAQDIDNDLISPPTTTKLGKTENEDKLSSTTKQTTKLQININKPTAESQHIEAITEEDVNCAEGEHQEWVPCSACEKSDFPPLFFPTVADDTAEGNIDEDNCEETKNNDGTLDLTDTEKALDSMLDDIFKLTSESFYDEKEDNRRSGSFTARKRWSRLKPTLTTLTRLTTLTNEQKIRLSIAHIADGKLDDLMLEDELDEKGEKRV